MLISVCLTSDIRLRAPLVAQGTRPILAATSEDRFAAGAALSPRSSLLGDGFLSLSTGPPPQKHRSEQLRRGHFSLSSAEHSAAIPAPGGMQVVGSSL